MNSVLAQGEYEYLCDGDVMPVAECWQLLRSVDGYEIRSTRTVPSQSLVISACARVRAGQITRCLLQWGLEPGGKTVARAFFRMNPDGLGPGECRSEKSPAMYRFRRSGTPSRSIPAVGVHFFPLMRIFSGQLIGALAKRGGSGGVLVPWIQDPSRVNKLFAPELSNRRVFYLGVGQAGFQGKACDCFHYSGGEYDNGAEYHLAEGLMWAYHWQQGRKEWQVRLKNFSGEWPGAALWLHPRIALAGLAGGEPY
ncbi:hypothetical protein [Microbulbifer aggregans]|uniref:hypothetical protein n=1 Tax=Microbulbifer aggregans TaxID=1769779 RepID=UPI001CFCC59E|nr:hypothetical protein [Microbulbifer aggregans]